MSAVDPPEPADRPGRRTLLKALGVGGFALGSAGAAVTVARVTGSDDDRPGALVLQAGDGSDITELEVRLGDDILPRVSDGRWRSERLPTSTHSMLAFTWRRGEPDPKIQVSSRVRGRWQDWAWVRPLTDLPDEDSGEGNRTVGTELRWVGDTDGIQVRMAGGRPRDLALVLLHPARRTADGRARARRAGAAAFTAQRRAVGLPTSAEPVVLNRQAWGADESWRSGTPRLNTTIEQAHVHHTVNSNTYAEADVPALIRGMYRYHTKNLGWSDLAYNFVVDRFGRTWVGRAGGAAKPVRGAHTLGFNATSVGIAALGNFDLVAPPAPMLDAIARVAAWKLAAYQRDPLGMITVTSQGSDNYRSGTVVALPVIDGHRDTNDTSCPGGLLYAALPTIRTSARSIIDQALQQPIGVTAPASLGGTPIVGQTLAITPGTYSPADATVTVTWLRDGAPVATGTTYVVAAADLGTRLSARLDVSRVGSLPVSEVLDTGVTAMQQAVLRVKVVGRRGRAIVRVRVTDAAGAPLDGQVKVKNGGRRQITGATGGKARLRLDGLLRGKHRVTTTFLGNATTLPAKERSTFRVR